MPEGMPRTHRHVWCVCAARASGFFHAAWERHVSSHGMVEGGKGDTKQPGLPVVLIADQLGNCIGWVGRNGMEPRRMP